MTKAETATLLRVIASAYPRSRWENFDETLEIWHEMLEDLDLPVVQLALKRMIAVLKYPPTVADLREAVAELATQGQLTPGQAWGKITAALRAFGYYQPEKAREALGEDLWSMVGQMGGWTHLCECENPDVVGAQFERRYKAMLDRRKDQIQVPGKIKQQFALMLEQVTAQALCGPRGMAESGALSRRE